MGDRRMKDVRRWKRDLERAVRDVQELAKRLASLGFNCKASFVQLGKVPSILFGALDPTVDDVQGGWLKMADVVGDWAETWAEGDGWAVRGDPSRRFPRGPGGTAAAERASGTATD